MKTLKRFLRAFPGSSCPTEVETTDGYRCILKLRGTGNGAQSLVSELIVNRIAVAAGFSVPEVFPLLVPDAFPWAFGTDEFDDLLRKSFGVNLGIQLIEGAQPLSAEEVRALPLPFLHDLVAVDAFFGNYDRLETSPNVARDTYGRPWLLDHGSCRFLDPMVAARPLALPRVHLLAHTGDELLRPDVLRRLAVSAALEAASATVPETWLQETGLNVSLLKQRLQDRVGRLRAAASLR